MPVSWSESVKQPTEDDQDPGEANSRPALERMVSLCYRKGKLGMAVWMKDDFPVIRLMEEQSELPGFPTVESVVFELDPTLLILPGKGDYTFIEEMKDLKNRFEREKGLSLVLSYGLSTEYKAAAFLASFGPLVDERQVHDHPTTIASAAALIAALKKTLRTSDIAFPTEVQWFSLSKCMAIDYDSLLALQILDDKLHPNMHFGEKRGGLCLQNIMNKCKSPAGVSLFKTWLMRPLTDVPSIIERQAKVEFLLNSILLKGLQGELYKHLRGLPRIEKVLARLGKPHYQRIVELAKFLKGSIELYSMDQRLQLGLLPACEGAKKSLSVINSIIDLEQSKKQEKLVIRQHVNPDLDRLRHQYRTLPSYLTAKVQLVAERIRNPMIRAVNIVYFPQLGFLVTISLEGKSRVKDIQSAIGDDFDLQFVTEHVAYFKDSITKVLDDEIGDIYADMTDLEIEIVLLVTDQILPHRYELCLLGRKLAELDCLLGLAEFAAENSLVKPTVIEEGPLHIIEGRHLLQERICDNIVPNDLRLGDEENGSVIILTGPNSSGKSIYMKQNALIVILGQMGSFVPAKEATIGIVDRIFTRIQTRESSLSGQSAFQTDLHQIKRAIEGCTSRSLLLIDEFGKGTNPTDGIAIFAATIKYFAAQFLEEPDEPSSRLRPRIIAITHFHEVYELDRRHPLGKFKWCTMDMLERPSAREDDECNAIAFLYRVITGKAVGSLGIRCAKLAGLPDQVILRAKELYALYQAQVPPITIRYAQLNPELEIISNRIIEVLREGENRDMETLRVLTQEFLAIDG